MRNIQLLKSYISRSFPLLFILFISLILSSCNPPLQPSSFQGFRSDSLNNFLIPIEKPIKKDNKTKINKALPPLKSEKFTSLLLPDFSVHKNSTEKKKAFFNFLKPIIEEENNRILMQRQFIIKQYELFQANGRISDKNRIILQQYTLDYRSVNTNLKKAKTYKELLLRVDKIPMELALVQAALESSWGSSYFARIANNLYGQWCFSPGCGVIPRARKAGDTHEVAKFKNLNLSVRSYMLFLNSHPLFSKLRSNRANSKLNQGKASAHEMAKGLKAYSARGNAYIHEVQNMIKTNSKYLKNNKTTFKSRETISSIEDADSLGIKIIYE